MCLRHICCVTEMTAPCSDTQHTENCANGGRGVRSLWCCRHTEPKLYGRTCHFSPSGPPARVSSGPQPTDIYPALLVAPGHWLPSSLPTLCLSLRPWHEPPWESKQSFVSLTGRMRAEARDKPKEGECQVSRETVKRNDQEQ